MKPSELENFLNTFLNTSFFNDYAPNGLQVEGGEKVSRIALGVSASMALFEKAKAIKADTLLVHHGLFWGKNPETLKGVLGKRVGFLYRNSMNLFGYHLPLDSHPEVGNNACIAEGLKLENRRPFARHGGVEIGVLGELPKTLSFTAVLSKLRKYFGQVNVSYSFGKKEIKTVAAVSGGAASDIYEAYSKGADLFVSGEVSEQTQEWCREAKMNFIAGGHYATEQFGIQKLGKVIEKQFGIPCTFIDINNKV